MSHAKAILFGEHSVIYNKKAIAIPLRNIKIKANIVKEKIKEDEHVEFIKNTIKKIYGIDEEIYLKIDSHIPISSGLGSSAALAISICDEFKRYFNIEIDYINIVDISENKAHGKSSGIDREVILKSKSIIFEKEKDIEIFEFDLKCYLVIADTGIKGNTKIAVSKIENNIEKNIKYIDELGNITNEAIENIKKRDLYKIGINMTQAHINLKKMGLSNDRIEKLIEVGKRIALGSKITGSGLGGCVIFLVKKYEDAVNLVELLTKEGVKNTWIEHI